MEKFVFPDYDPDAQLFAISEVIRSLDKVLEAKERVFDETNYSNLNPDYSGDMYAGDLHELGFLETAVSHSAIAVIAPFLEGLFRYEIAALHDNGYRINPEYPRANQDKFWEIEFALNEKGKMKKNIAMGIYQILEALGLLSFFPVDFKVMLSIIFKYRNYTLHNGFEAKMEQRNTFKNDVEQLRCSAYFSWVTTDGRPWLVTMKKEFILQSFNFCIKVKEGFDKQKGIS